jgi:hypothetical protein
MIKPEKEKAIVELLKNPKFANMPSSQIAKLVGVADKTVTRIRKENKLMPDQIITADGKTRDPGRASTRRPNRDELEAQLQDIKAENEKLKNALHHLSA